MTARSFRDKVLMIVGVILLFLGFLELVIAPQYRVMFAWSQVAAGAVALIASFWKKLTK